MKLSQDFGTGNYLIRSYTPGRVTINDETLSSSVVISQTTLVRDWPPELLSELEIEHMEAVIALEPEVILLGTGPVQRFPDRAILREMLKRGIGVEVMDTAAACRTYNVLTGEDRKVAAALLLR